MAKKKAIKKAVKKTTLKKGSAEAKRKMAKVRAAKTKEINKLKKEQLKGKLYQRAVKKTTTGGKRYKYNVIKDENLPAKKPGKRIAKKSGNVYYEYRVNRSDMPGSLTGMEKHYDKNSHNYNFTISGLNSKRDLLDKVYKNLAMAELSLLSYKNALKNYKLDTLTKNKYNKEIKFINKTINQYKKNIALLKK
jgi:hypothetical protein